MVIKEERMDLFTVPQGYYLAHCISADFALGAGIAKQFVDVYNMRDKLKAAYSDDAMVGEALLVDNVFNLVTKARAFQKPTYESLEEALIDMKLQILELMITKLAIPMIGCGLDKLDWSCVKSLIETTFEDIDIEILVCYL